MKAGRTLGHKLYNTPYQQDTYAIVLPALWTIMPTPQATQGRIYGHHLRPSFIDIINGHDL